MTRAKTASGASRCGVCNSERAEQVNEAMKLPRSEQSIATEFGFTKAAIHRHKAHIRHLLQVVAQEERDTGEIRALKAKAQREVDHAKDPKVRIMAMGRLQGLIELELRAQQQVDSTHTLEGQPAFQLFITKLLATVGTCATCRQAVLDADPGGTRAE